ncbi:NAD(P)H-hydrate dehydratase [Marinilongibacter aquaticus]|uniref:NAD(P)H-hydrate dehydratase n=1 Tax=Marinilongibacter aquaticus TaxID=2975157 RepID=UPI0021BD1212|nr:NAD(P)H-hydrate dehydratase [Marinilongibacter aquaticus]UBM59798.1 NAD(P)H-hydrate dehydratase [Marinilongibacter aquaticus]
MKILTAAQTAQADKYTIEHEPISSIDLMERAATACANWLIRKFNQQTKIAICCGPGNNGGDGLAIARLLIENNYQIEVYILYLGNKLSADAKINLEHLQQMQVIVHEIHSESDFPNLNKRIVIDSIFGTGLNRPLQGLVKDFVNYLNKQNRLRISIDVPSGLQTEFNDSSDELTIFKADYTLTFEQVKLAFLLPTHASFVGEFVVLPIELHPDFLAQVECPWYYTQKSDAKNLLKKRDKFSHKGTFGHAQLIAGSKGKMGAAYLSAKACLRIGAGLCTVYTPKCGLNIMQSLLPEAMVIENKGTDYLEYEIQHVDDFQIGIGPGIGQHERTEELLLEVLKKSKKGMVIDADALNILAKHRSWWKYVPENCILTPHPKEFYRLVEGFDSEKEKIDKLLQLAQVLKSVVVLKGAHTAIASPEGKIHFNSTGNPGMATAGSGDVLTGILTGLLAQQYSSLDAAILGVYIHGLSGDIAVEKMAEESVMASDIVAHLSEAFNLLKRKDHEQ